MDWLFGWFFDLMYILQKSICAIIDFIVEIFFKLAGLEQVYVDGKQTDLLSHFALSDGVKTAFLGVMLIGIILLCIFVIIAIIRSEYADERQKKTKGQILTKAGQSFLTFLVIPFLLLTGIMLTNVIIGAINGAMTSSITDTGKVLFGGQILVTSGDGAYIGNAAQRSEIERMFLSGQLDYNNLKVVKEYYDLSEMNFFVGIASGLVILVMFALAALKFVQRLFDIILLYIISPISVSTIPADDGQRFKLWKEMLISKVLGAYGIILSMNLFFLIIPQVTRISFFGSSFQNGLVTILFIIGGAFAVSKAQMVIAQLTGSNAGAQEAQQMMAGIHAGVRTVRAISHGGAALAGRIVGGSDYRSNQKKGVGMGDNINASLHSSRNQHVVNNNGGKGGGTDGKGGHKDGKTKPDGDKKHHCAGQTAAHIAGGVGRLATLPVGVVKDLTQGGAITAGKNLWPRMRNVVKGHGPFNRADVVRRQAEKAAEKAVATTTETTTAKTGAANTTTGGTNV